MGFSRQECWSGVPLPWSTCSNKPQNFDADLGQVVLVVNNPAANAGDTRDTSSISGSGRSPGEGNGNPLQYSCLEDPTDRGAWWATVHGVTKSWTRLSHFTFTFIMVQLSHPYMTTGKTIALTVQTFVTKGRSLLFSALSKLAACHSFPSSHSR